MADSKQGALNLVDQGTVFMLSLSCGLLAVALIYFTCVWYRKKNAKVEQKKTPTIEASTVSTGSSNKPSINRTFSRFSQVDEECTFYGDDHDLDLLKSYVEANENKHNKSKSVNAANQIKRSRSAAADVSTRIVPVSREHRKSAPIEERGYLETDL